MHLNIEIKAKCSNPGRIEDILKSQDAEYRGLDHQIDTYFNVPNGRLKLREGNIENALVFYQRSDKEGPKDSKVILYQNQPDPILKKPNPNLKKALEAACGTLVVVDKWRHIYFINNVKFHIDLVKSLGNFCEIEAIDQTGEIGRERLLRQCRDYMGLLEIRMKDLVSNSYSDMLLGKTTTQ